MNKRLTLLYLSGILLSGCAHAQNSSCQEGINLLPMYGKVQKCAEQVNSDKEFFATIDAQFKDRSAAASQFVKSGWDYFDKSELETSMKRFNQAWLLDSLNADVYWGFGNLLGRNNQFEGSIPLFERSLQLKPGNAKVYEAMATSYGQLFVATNETSLLNKAIVALRKADSLDRNNPRILAQLTSAFTYFNQKDSANKYLRLTDRIDPNAIHPDVRATLK